MGGSAGNGVAGDSRAARAREQGTGGRGGRTAWGGLAGSRGRDGVRG
jgi:hypothetical protein